MAIGAQKRVYDSGSNGCDAPKELGHVVLYCLGHMISCSDFTQVITMHRVGTKTHFSEKSCKMKNELPFLLDENLMNEEEWLC